MHIRQIKLEHTEATSELSARVSVESPLPREYRIWFRGPRDCFGDAPLGDVFFAAFWISAMFLHERFVIEGEVSREIHDAAYERLEPVFLRWWRRDFRPAPLEGATLVDGVENNSPNVGMMFSAGLDSTYTAVRRQDELGYMIYTPAFDGSNGKSAHLAYVKEHLENTAAEYGNKLLVLESNLFKPIGDLVMASGRLGRPRPGFFHDCQFGSSLVAFGLCFRGMLGRVLISSSWSYEYLEPKGSHPLIEPNWSTNSMKFELVGCEADRIDKFRYIVQTRPEILRTLRVCSEPFTGGPINCGRCSKCTRTMMAMRLAGASDYMQSFRAPLDLEHAKLIKYSLNGELLPELLEHAKRIGDKEVARTAGIILGEHFYWPRVRARLRDRVKEWRSNRQTLRKLRRRKVREERKHQT